MLIKSVCFSKSVYDLSLLPADGLPEIAFAGKSNVGKSSFINTLIGRKKLAKISKSPGRTQSINFYLVNEALYFVDLPGYGYAQVSLSTRESWKDLIEGYLTNRPGLKAISALFDIRRVPDAQDISWIEWLKINKIPTLIVLTKADKLSNNEIFVQLKKISRALSVTNNDMVTFSSVTGAGKTEFLERLTPLLPL